MRAFITEAPAPNPPALLRDAFSREAGTFALFVPPAGTVRNKQTRKTLGIPFFDCLGKNLGLVGAYTVTTPEFRHQIEHWFSAYNARHLVVFNGDALAKGGVEAVLEYAAPVPQVTFVAEPGQHEKVRRAVQAAEVPVSRLAWDDLLNALPDLPQSHRTIGPNARTASAVPGETPVPYEMGHLPTVDFLLFRHQARTLNTPERFAAIDADYRAAYKAALDFEPEQAAVIAGIAEVTREATSTAPIMVALRATQAALLTRGWLLAAHPDKAIGTLCAIRPPRPTDDHWRALHGYVRTARVAGVALFLLDVPPGDLNAITVGDVAGFLREGAVRGRPIPALARPLLQVHHSVRISQGAAPGDPYLNQKGARRHHEDLIDARRHLSIPIDARQLHSTLAHSHRALWRIGLELRDLT